ncbi:MAG: YcxB family protein [Pseudomonadota bacterium]
MHLEVTYTNTYWELVGNNMRVIFRHTVVTPICLLILLAGSYNQATDAAGHFYFRYFLKDAIYSLILFTVIASVLFAFLPLPIIWSKGKTGVLGPHRIQLTDAGLIEETSVNKTELKWSGITKIRTNRSHIRIYISPYNLFLIPRKAFESRQQSEDFSATARKFMASAREETVGAKD